jgi:hypothetical protein
MSVLTELDAFYTEHRRCGALEAGIDEPVIWIDCECGARIARRADDGEACCWLWCWRCGVGGGSSMRWICHEVGRGKLRGPSTGVPIDAPGVGPPGLWLDLPA